MNGTIHVAVGGGGRHLSHFGAAKASWSIFRDSDFWFCEILLFQYKKSSEGEVDDSLTISRDYRDVLACVHDCCESITLAT